MAYRYVEDEGSELVSFNRDGEVTVILFGSKVGDLSARLVAVSRGVFYIETTDEFDGVNVYGEQVGAPLPEVPTNLPEGDQIVGTTVWTLWPDDGATHYSQRDNAYVTRSSQPRW